MKNILSFVANKAANLIKRDGWLQADLGSPGGPQCLLGACNTAAAIVSKNLDINSNALGIAVATKVASKAAKKANIDPELWNDMETRTARQVINALRSV